MAKADNECSSARVGDGNDQINDTFTVNFGNAANQLSLQDAFSKFLSVKKRATKGKKRKKKRSKKRMAELRQMFLAQALKYRGVPYAKRYFTPDDPEYEAPLFLDCCALIRRVMRDLKDEFGFTIGPWNQAYMYDTLWKNISDPKDLKPGDLVFVKGTYHDPKKRQQKHFITHVEIWMGDGEKSLGARWQRGKVQIFDSYKFDSKSYHIEEFIFKSIDPWLAGHCKSHCRLHKWKIRKVKPKNKYSIFADGQQVNSLSSFTSSSTTTTSKSVHNSVEQDYVHSDLDINASDYESDKEIDPDFSVE